MAAGGLGKGLNSLIPQNLKKGAPQPVASSGILGSVTNSPQPPAHANEAVPSGERVVQLAVDKISSNKYQPRQLFNHSEIENLSNSIKEHGILQPLIVTSAGNGLYELIAGERRLRAARVVGLATVPAIIREASSQQKLELALIENIQRHDLNLVEEAVAYKRLVDEFSLSHDDVARRVGKSRSVVSNAMRILNLPEEVQMAVREGKISSSHARSIAALPDPKDQIDLFHRIINEHLNVRDVENAARKMVVQKHIRRVGFDPVVEDMVEHLRNALGTKVSIKKKGDSGSISINFFSDEELNNIVKKITEA